MGKLHEVLAIEKQHIQVASQLIAETHDKFKKPAYFNGFSKKLSMIKDAPDKEAIERAGSTEKALPTTVKDTLDYALKFWADAEDVLFQKNKSNQSAISDIVVNGNVIASDVPVDELLGLENRLGHLRSLFMQMPTLDASMKWERDPTAGENVWVSQNDEVTTKTEKITFPVVLYEATAEHPAQVKESSKDEVVGAFVTRSWSGAASAAQKAKALSTIDELITAVKKARVQANQIEASTDKIGETIVQFIMSSFRQ